MPGFYGQTIFPYLCDFLLDQPAVARLRGRLLTQAGGQILEIGFGTGLNLRHYPDHVRKITTVDPNPGMHRLACRRIRSSSIEVDRRLLGGECLPFPDGSFDCVVSTFTLCSISQVKQALGQIYRVLKPGGRFLFLEHGLNPDPAVQRWQRRLNWLEMHVADGCRLDRDMRALIGGQPFTSLQVEEFRMPDMPGTHGYMYQGMGVK